MKRFVDIDDLALRLWMCVAIMGLPMFISGCQSSGMSEPTRTYVVAVFAGHTAQPSNLGVKHQGAGGASGIMESCFNDDVVRLIERTSDSLLIFKTYLSVNNIILQKRLEIAEQNTASAIIEIHHDSVQPGIYSYLLKSKSGDPMRLYYRGFSLHVYPNEGSIRLAKAIESAMISLGLIWSEYHTEDIPEERMKLVPGTKAVYERPNLFILRSATVPAVIVECGCIANPEEEELLKTVEYRSKLVQGIRQGVLSFLESNSMAIHGEKRRRTLSKSDVKR